MAQHAWRRWLARATGSWQLERLAALDEKVSKFGRAQRVELAAQQARLDAIAATLSSKAGTDAVRDLGRRLERVQTALAHQDRSVSEALERARLLDEQGVDDRRFARRMEQVVRDARPIVVGPWTGEVGFELLYWVPFVRRVLQTYGIPRDRVHVVSRGGSAPWYSGLLGEYTDVFSLMSVEEFRAATETAKKQRQVGAFDAAIVQRLMAARGGDRPALLHPGLMYRLFMPFWKGLATDARVRAYTAYARLSTAALAPIDLPPSHASGYTAVRFYFSECFPDTAANRAFAADALAALAAERPVVLLNTPFDVDDHRDLVVHGERVITLGGQMTPERNLAVQTAIIAGASAFVGTYGGYSYLAPFYGVPSLAFYSEPTFKIEHLHLAQRVFHELGGASLVPLDVAAAPLVRGALGTVTGARA